MRLPKCSMSMRLRFAFSVAAVAMLSTTAVSVLSYRSTKSTLDQAISASLHEAAHREAEFVADEFKERTVSSSTDRVRFTDVVDSAGTGRDLVVVAWFDGEDIVLESSSTERLLVDEVDQVNFAAAAGQAASLAFEGPRLHDTQTTDGHRRVASVPVSGVGGVMVGRSLDEYNQVLSHLYAHLVQMIVLASVASALLGCLLAGSATKRLRSLTAAVTTITQTGELNHNIKVPHGKDEAGQLTVAFDKMIRALATSKEQQRRLVQDASHELRTPLTSLRTNLAVLPRVDRLGIDDRQRLINDLQTEVEELTVLVDELVNHATETVATLGPEKVAIGPTAQKIVDRVANRSGRAISVEVDDSTVFVPEASLERAVLNLLNNAVKFSPAGAPIRVKVSNGSVTVTDEGNGIAATDLPRVFDRFYRATEQQNLPGSGLGLSIVADIADRWGGTVCAQNIEPHGTAVTITLPKHPSAVTSAPSFRSSSTH